MTAPLLRVRDLVVRFRARRGIDAILSNASSHVTAVDRVSFDVFRGETFGLVGESGSGKTTLGKAVLRLYQPTAGRIQFRGNDIDAFTDRQMRPLRKDLQMVFQDPLSSLNPRQRVREVLATPLKLHGTVREVKELDKSIDRTLERVGLSSVYRNRFPHELSGGQLQRVAIGRALTMHPALLVADEAVSKLDVSVRAQILNLFKDIQDELGSTIIFITHDLHVARFLCQRIGVMYFGKLVEIAPTGELYARPRHPYTQALLGTLAAATQSDEMQAGLAGEAFNPVEDCSIGCRFHKRCWLSRPHCMEAHPRPERISEHHRIECYEWRRSFDLLKAG